MSAKLQHLDFLDLFKETLRCLGAGPSKVWFCSLFGARVNHRSDRAALQRRICGAHAQLARWPWKKQQLPMYFPYKDGGRAVTGPGFPAFSTRYLSPPETAQLHRAAVHGHLSTSRMALLASPHPRILSLFVLLPQNMVVTAVNHLSSCSRAEPNPDVRDSL